MWFYIFQKSQLGCSNDFSRPPLGNTYEALSFFAWATVLVYLGLELRFRRKVIGAFVLPIVLLTALAAASVPKGSAVLSPAFRNTWVWLHVTFVLLGCAALALTCGVGLMYLLQERQLKSKSLGVIYYRSPSLGFFVGLGERAGPVGFPLLPAGLLPSARHPQAHRR